MVNNLPFHNTIPLIKNKIPWESKDNRSYFKARNQQDTDLYVASLTKTGKKDGMHMQRGGQGSPPSQPSF